MVERQLWSHTLLWYEAARSRPLQLVIVRDPAGHQHDDFFITSDIDIAPAGVASLYSDRWAIEDSNRNLKQYLGVQDPQSWVGDGPERVVALAGWLYSAVWQWYLTVHAEHPTWPYRPWYTTKRAPSFADALAALRGETWAAFLDAPPRDAHSHKSPPRSSPYCLTRRDQTPGVAKFTEWYVTDIRAPHAEREARTVGFQPTVVPTYDGLLDRAVKLVGVSDDYDLVERCEASVQKRFATHVSASRSQPYYLDVTHPTANKGVVIERLSTRFNIPLEQVATLGDQLNDVLMFERGGMSIAMGNASEDVQRQATYVTASNEDEGFARAIEQFVLPRVVAHPTQSPAG